MWPWSAEMSASVAALAALLSGATSLALAWFTWRLVILTKTLAEETRLTRQVNERADVQLAIEPHPRGGNIFELVIANTGKAAAKNLIVQIGEDSLSERRRGTGPVNRSITTLLPGSQTAIFLGPFFGDEAKAKIVRARATYQDSFGNHTLEIEQKISGWFGPHRLSRYPDFKAADALEKIFETMRSWSGSSRLNVDIHTRQDRNFERAEMERIWSEQASAEQSLEEGEGKDEQKSTD
ncbi:hypothetical protein LPC08_04560 [Roseomonas sp. OT10]|uniref:hypothetical protein n=1 Tax=Roseomonas cutis TaxID=2897332 RepID=UPI001E5A33EF|nr:hypothetical protein [Roseomonas sp. OT10]UFN49918.1 hypothetical protein LPC08_04560 [Roseomonas sp. OT10]